VGLRNLRRNGGAGGGKFCIVGGYAGKQHYGEVEEYDPANNIWTERRAMLIPRYGVAAARRNGILYVLGGMGESGLSKANEIYVP
jgi:hypothetical protein